MRCRPHVLAGDGILETRPQLFHLLQTGNIQGGVAYLFMLIRKQRFERAGINGEIFIPNDIDGSCPYLPVIISEQYICSLIKTGTYHALKTV